MSGCGGCGPDGCSGPCSRRPEAPRNSSLTEALAKVIIDNRVVRFAVEAIQTNPELTADDVVAMVNDAKTIGEL